MKVFVEMKGVLPSRRSPAQLGTYERSGDALNMTERSWGVPPPFPGANDSAIANKNIRTKQFQGVAPPTNLGALPVEDPTYQYSGEFLHKPFQLQDGYVVQPWITEPDQVLARKEMEHRHLYSGPHGAVENVLMYQNNRVKAPRAQANRIPLEAPLPLHAPVFNMHKLKWK